MSSKNTRRSLELLETLRPKQQAALLFEAIAEGNADECERIKAAVERRSYTSPHTVFTDWRECLDRLAAFVCIEYWRGQFLNAFELLHVSELAPEKEEKEIQALERLDRRLLSTRAIVKAFADVCEENGFDFAAVINSCTPYKIDAAADEPCNLEEHQLWLECFRDLLPKYQPHQNIHDLPRGANP